MSSDHLTFRDLLEACRTHDLRTLSLAYGLRKDELQALDAAVRGPISVNRGQILCPAGRPCDTLYVIYQGAFKSHVTSATGEERIVRFMFKGELIGLDALYDGNHHSSATALLSSYVFRIPARRLSEITGAVPGLQRELLRLAVQNIRDDEEHMLLIEQKPAGARVATYFLHLNRRQQSGCNPPELHLPMTRNDLASYLGLASETLSRELSSLAHSGLIEIPDTKHIRLLAPDRLADLVGIKSG